MDRFDQLISKLDVERLLTEVVGFIPAVIAALVIFAVFLLIFRLTRGPLRSAMERAGFPKPLVAMLADTVYRVALLGFGLVMAADQIGINVAAAVAGIGVVGIAVGFAAQDTIANIIAGFLIFADKPFEMGDWITVTGEYGMVTEITMRSTRIRTNQNTFVVIPNKQIIDSVLVNHSKNGDTRVDVPIGIAYKENIPAARDAVLAAVREIQDVKSDPPPDLVVTDLGASSVNMNVRVWIDDASRERPVFYRTMEASKIALDKAGIEIPYHHLQLFIENIGEPILQKAAEYFNPAIAGQATSLLENRSGQAIQE